MRNVRLCGLGLAAGFAALAICFIAPQAGAQDRPNTEVVPHIPHSAPGWFYIPQAFDLAKGHTIAKDAIGPGKLRDWLAKIPAEKGLIVLDAREAGANEAFRGGDRERETVPLPDGIEAIGCSTERWTAGMRAVYV